MVEREVESLQSRYQAWRACSGDRKMVERREVTIPVSSNVPVPAKVRRSILDSPGIKCGGLVPATVRSKVRKRSDQVDPGIKQSASSGERTKKKPVSMRDRSLSQSSGPTTEGSKERKREGEVR